MLEELRERTAEYYKSLTEEELEEDKEWVEFTTEQAEEIWE